MLQFQKQGASERGLRKGISAMSKILIIDDDKMILKIASFMLTKAGHAVITADSGSEAAALISSESPDLTLLDNEMPGVSGLDALRAIRADEAISSAKVCMMTGSVTDELKAECEKLGAVNCIGKPLVKGEVLAVIDSL